MLDDPDALARRLASWLMSRHPGMTDARVGALAKSSGGFSNITLMGELDCRRGGGRERLGIVVRVQPLSSAVYPDCDVTRQYRVMERLAGSAVPVPALLGLETDAAVIGAPFYVMQRVDGRVPDENPLYHVAGWFHDLSAEEQRRYWFSGIEVAAAVGRVDWRARGLDFLLPPAGRTPLAQQLDYGRRHLLWSEGLARPYPALHRAYDWLRANQPRDEPIGLIWGDAKLGNCVCRDGAVVAALDWEMAALGNPVDNLAWWLMLDESLCTGWGLPRLAGLPSREESLAHWQRCGGADLRDREYYEIHAAWRFAIAMTRIGTLLMDKGYTPREARSDEVNCASALLAAHAARHGF
jgi:aminoglycoside phosphotransferase (APT) family kinase protein